MRLLDLVEQQNGVRATPHRLGELATFVVADVARGRADQACHRMLLHVLRHVETHHRALVIEQEVGEGFCGLGLAHTGRAKEQETPDRTIGILQTRTRAPHRVGNRRDGITLPDDAMRQFILELREPLTFRFEHALHRNPGPLRDYGRDVVVADLLLEESTPAVTHRHILRRLREVALQLRNPPIANLGRELQVAGARRLLGVGGGLIDQLLDATHLTERLLLLLPLRLHRRTLRLQLGQLALERHQPLPRRRVGLLLHRLTLDLELHDATLHLVDRLRQRIDLDPQTTGRFVEQVDRLVRQEAIADVAVRQRCRCHDCAVGDAHAVVRLVARLQTAEDRDRVIERRLTDVHRLEATFERGILLEV